MRVKLAFSGFMRVVRAHSWQHDSNDIPSNLGYGVRVERVQPYTRATICGWAEGLKPARERA